MSSGATRKSKTNLINKLPIATAVLGILLVGIWFYSQFERAPTTLNLGYSLEAKRNQYLAAQQFLQQQGISASSALSLADIIDSLEQYDLLMLLNDRALTGNYQDRLMQWVRDGGHLILVAQSPWNEDAGLSGDQFLDDLGLRLYPFEDENPSEEASLAEALQEITDANGEMTIDDEDEAEQCPVYSKKNLASFTYGENNQSILVDFHSDNHLYDSDAEDDNDYTNLPNPMLQYNIDAGLITVLNSYRQWQNTQIGWHDHAFFLWLLAKNAHHVWFVFNHRSDSLLSLLMQHLPEPLLAGFVLLALYLWHRGKRFGPVAAAASLDRRRLQEHLIASARFDWQHQQIEPNIDALRDDIRQRSQRRWGDKLSDEALFECLAKHSQLTPQQVHWALTEAVPRQEQSFSQMIGCLQQLRNRL